MPIIDLRYRPPTQEVWSSFLSNPVYAEYARANNLAHRQVKILSECVNELKDLNVLKAVVAGRDIETTYHTRSTNDAVLNIIRAYPDIFIGYYGYDPHKGMAGYRSFKYAIEHEGFVGASIDPAMAKCFICDEKYYPMYALCCEYDIPVIITAGLSPHLYGLAIEHTDPRYADRVARDFPELRMLISHGGYPWVNETVGICMRHKHVYMDFSSGENKLLGEYYIKAANEYISDRIVFSSTSPLIDIRNAISHYSNLPLSKEARLKMFYTNAIRFLKLD